MSPRLLVLAETLTALGQAAGRLAATHAGVTALFPLTPAALEGLADAGRERLDAYAIRYARCQDLLFPAMRALHRAQLEPAAERDFLSLFALMQRQGITADLDQWERQRDPRNAVGHDYPQTAVIADLLNAIRLPTPEVLDYVARLRAAAAALAPAGDNRSDGGQAR